MEKVVEQIPDTLIYEMVDGKPIYYKGYKEVLDQNNKIEEVIVCSLLQSLITTGLIFALQSKLDRSYTLLSSELGVQLKEKKLAYCRYSNRSYRSTQKGRPKQIP